MTGEYNARIIALLAQHNVECRSDGDDVYATDWRGRDGEFEKREIKVTGWNMRALLAFLGY